MPTRTRYVVHSLAILIVLGCCGCPTPPGGDPAVWHSVTVHGTGEIFSVSEDTAEVSLRWTDLDGEVDEEAIENVRLSEIVGLPDGYAAEVGNQMTLSLKVRWHGKSSVGPPDLLHDRVAEREFTYVGPADTAASKTEKPEGDIAQVIWETAGGGEIQFTITPSGTDFEIHLESFGFRPQDVDLSLTPASGNPYEVVKAIFSRQRDVKKDTFTPGGPTGSWTSITLVGSDGNRTEISSVSPSGELGSIYDFVAAAAKTDEPETPSKPGPEPPVPSRESGPTEASSITSPTGN